MEECLYFTRRKLEPRGSVVAWAFRKECPSCKALMRKPTKRSPRYECPSCGYAEEKKEHEASILLRVKYECPFCGKRGETTAPYKRRTWRGVQAYVFQCEFCKERIGITKKLKSPKSSGEAALPEEG